MSWLRCSIGKFSRNISEIPKWNVSEMENYGDQVKFIYRNI